MCILNFKKVGKLDKVVVVIITDQRCTENLNKQTRGKNRSALDKIQNNSLRRKGRESFTQKSARIKEKKHRKLI